MNREQLLIEADRCVKCGMCLPHCPTYRLTLDESDSPRGRIALIQALAEGNVSSDRLLLHLDRCLGCLSCESACPSGVQYARLIDGVRSDRALRRQERLWLRLLRGAISRYSYQDWYAGLLRIYRASGASKIIRRFGNKRIADLDRLLPDPLPGSSFAPVYPAPSNPRARVGLFTGCIARLTDRAALEAGIRVLNRLGVEVIVPPDQGCCGAMHQHGGDQARADGLAANNRNAFAGKRLDAIVHLASGCGMQLESYGETGTPLAAPVMEICRYIDSLPWPDTLPLAACPQLLALHTPCTQRDSSATAALLGRIPGLKIHPLGATGCCGSAGTYLLRQPEFAARLRRPLIEELSLLQPELLATTNPGCAMHLAAGIREAGPACRVVHPVQLIYSQMEEALTGQRQE